MLTAVRNNEKKTFSIALGGMIAALSVALMFLSALFQIAEFVFPALAGIFLICAVYEMGEGWAFLIFAAVSILSLLLPANKDATIYYIFFLGHYPIVKSFIERINNKVLKWAVKIVIFNVCAAGAFIISINLLGLTVNMMKYGNIGYILIALLLNVTFVIYDIAVSGLVVTYSNRIRKIIHRH